MTSLSADGGAETEALRAEVQQLHSQVEALEERVDFAERLLSQRDRQALPRKE